MIPSVVVNDLNIRGSNFSPDEADAPLIIDADTVLPLPIALQCFQVIARRCLQEGQSLCCVELRQLAFRNLAKGFEATGTLALVQREGVLALERLDHARIVLRAA